VRHDLIVFTRLFENRLTRPIKRSIVKSIAAKDGPRTLLNHYYGCLSDDAKSRFHARYAKIFREENAELVAGEWSIHFIDRRIRLPLRPMWSWLDWDNAISILGHDVEIKQTYAALITSDERPNLFIDIGANYGMHSMLFLSAAIPVIAFEPNPTCFSHFETICELNGYSGRWEQVAIGNMTGEVELVYPEKSTWLGSAASNVIAIVKESNDVISQKVPLRRLDDYITNIPREKVLIKIDVEGSESDVIQGAPQLLRECRPKLIFESNNLKMRSELFRQFERFQYSVQALPWRPSVAQRLLGADEFIASAGTNFIAIPAST
jgi:FkbM family methyltransferase